MNEYTSKDFHEWWSADEKTVHDSVWKYVRQVQHDQQDLHESNIAFARLYSNREEPGLTGGPRVPWRPGWTSVTENVIKSTIDTAGSLIGKNHPRLKVLTDGGAWSFQMIAKKLERYAAGMFEALDVYSKTYMMFRDACIFGTGVLRIEARDGEPCLTRVLIDEIIVDEEEVDTDGNPLQIHQVGLIAKEVLMQRYPDAEEAIRNAPAGTLWPGGEYNEPEPSMALFIESWHLPMGDEPGRYVASIHGKALEDKEYNEDYFPHLFFHWSPPLTGFYGLGLAEELLGFQIRLNELNDFIRDCQDLVSSPKFLVPSGSRVSTDAVTNAIGEHLEYMGDRPPTWYSPPSLAPEIYQERERIRQAALEMAGISRMSAHAVKPAGVDHAVGMRELSDHQSQRFSDIQRRYEQLHIELGYRLFAIAKDLYEDNDEGAPVFFMSPDFVESINWEDLELDDHRLTFSVQASSILSDTPSGRFQRVVELQQYGVALEPGEVRRLLDLPDLDNSTARGTSDLEHAEWTIEQLSKNNLVLPDAFINLPQTLERVRQAYLAAFRAAHAEGEDGPSEEVLDTFRQYLQQGVQEVQKQQAEQMAQQQVMMPPQGQPQPGPQQPIA